MLHIAVNVTVLKLVLHMPAILCPKGYDQLVSEQSPFSTLITSMPVYQPLLGSVQL